ATEEEVSIVRAPAQPPPIAVGLFGQQGSESLDPGQDGPGRDVDPALGQEFGNVPGGERVAEVPVDGGQDHLSRPTVAGEGGTGELGEVPAAASTGVALTTATTGVRAGRLLSHEITEERGADTVGDVEGNTASGASASRERAPRGLATLHAPNLHAREGNTAQHHRLRTQGRHARVTGTGPCAASGRTGQGGAVHSAPAHVDIDCLRE